MSANAVIDVFQQTYLINKFLRSQLISGARRPTRPAAACRGPADQATSPPGVDSPAPPGGVQRLLGLRHGAGLRVAGKRPRATRQPALARANSPQGLQGNHPRNRNRHNFNILSFRFSVLLL